MDQTKLICQICNNFTHTKRYLFRHVTQCHKWSVKDYYDRFIKLPQEGLCKMCNKPTHWSVHHVYGNYCSKTCQWKDINVVNKRKKTCLEKFGVDFAFKALSVREKILETTTLHYGKPYILQTKHGQDLLTSKMTPEKIQQKEQHRTQTNLIKYGTCYPSQLSDVKEKMYATNINKYGTKLPIQNKIILDKVNATNLKNHGVLWNMQRPDIIEKMMKTMDNVAYLHKPYILPSGIIIHKQGYEAQFLDYVFTNDILKEEEIDYCPKGIKYIGIDDKAHYYFPDFQISKWNLVVEIKSDYIMKLDKNVYLKEAATKFHGFNYIRILNNKSEMLIFDEFNQRRLTNFQS